MPQADPGEVTRLLVGASEGDEAALGRLLPIVYDEMRRLAQGHIAAERANHTFSATALVHEVFLRLVQQDRLAARSRREFFAVAAGAMRRILVDHARTKNRRKRGGGNPVSALDERVAAVESRAIDLLALNDALDQLAAVDPVKARLVELRFFGELPMSEAAAYLDLPLRTAERHWTMARAWLRSRMGDAAPTDEAEG